MRPPAQHMHRLTTPPQKVFPNPLAPSTSYLLTYLDAAPPNPGLAVGTTTELPPTPRSFEENPRFLAFLAEVLAAHAHLDPDLRAAAQAFASPGGGSLGGRGGKRDAYSGGAGGASDQGGAGGGGAGGWVHLSDVSACDCLFFFYYFFFFFSLGSILAAGGEAGWLTGWTMTADLTCRQRRNPPDFGRIAW